MVFVAVPPLPGENVQFLSDVSVKASTAEQSRADSHHYCSSAKSSDYNVRGEAGAGGKVFGGEGRGQKTSFVVDRRGGVGWSERRIWKFLLERRLCGFWLETQQYCNICHL